MTVPAGILACFIRLGNFFNQEILGLPPPLQARRPRGSVGGAAAAGGGAAASAAAGPGGGAAASE
jgi:prolipoprotein diacylglyceryltransferase